MLRLDMHMIAGVLQYVAVASFAEAWIEKALRLSTISANSSPPSRRRGLKTFLYCTYVLYAVSPPSRRRGLKIDYIITQTKQMSSPPSRRRGLKI